MITNLVDWFQCMETKFIIFNQNFDSVLQRTIDVRHREFFKKKIKQPVFGDQRRVNTGRFPGLVIYLILVNFFSLESRNFFKENSTNVF